MKEDWRLTNQMNYLYRAALKKAVFEASSTNDHKHCEFCFDKFGEDAALKKAGYCTLDSYHWICDECFRDFCEQFEWRIENDETESLMGLNGGYTSYE